MSVIRMLARAVCTSTCGAALGQPGWSSDVDTAWNHSEPTVWEVQVVGDWLGEVDLADTGVAGPLSGRRNVWFRVDEFVDEVLVRSRHVRLDGRLEQRATYVYPVAGTVLTVRAELLDPGFDLCDINYDGVVDQYDWIDLVAMQHLCPLTVNAVLQSREANSFGLGDPVPGERRPVGEEDLCPASTSGGGVYGVSGCDGCERLVVSLTDLTGDGVSDWQDGAVLLAALSE